MPKAVRVVRIETLIHPAYPKLLLLRVHGDDGQGLAHRLGNRLVLGGWLAVLAAPVTDRLAVVDLGPHVHVLDGMCEMDLALLVHLLHVPGLCRDAS